MRQSALTNAAISNIQKDLLSQPLQLLSGVDILGNASSALSNMSKGIAALSMDKKFIQSRMRQVCFFHFLFSKLLHLYIIYRSYYVFSRIAKEWKTSVMS
jgi:hypothetical protein